MEKGAELEARSKSGLTPLMHAAFFSKRPEMITLLLAKGADPLAKDESGKKAIDYAEKNPIFFTFHTFSNLHNLRNRSKE